MPDPLHGGGESPLVFKDLQDARKGGPALLLVA
jgi:hypothetical protein